MYLYVHAYLYIDRYVIIIDMYSSRMYTLTTIASSSSTVKVQWTHGYHSSLPHA